LKKLLRGERARLEAAKADALKCYLGRVADAIRRSQHSYWCRHGEGAAWEREFYQPPRWFRSGEPLAPSGFLGIWSRVLEWYRAGAQYRLRNMGEAYTAAESGFFAEVERLRGLTEEDVVKGLNRGSVFEYLVWSSVQAEREFPDGVSLQLTRGDVLKVFWEFEAFAQNIRSALDTLVRLVAPSYLQPVPTSISRLSRSSFTDEAAAELRAAWTGWGQRLGDYRDCVVHYTPLTLEPFIRGSKVGGKWRVGCYLPDNPSAKHVDRFRFGGQLDVVVYSAATLRNLDRLASKVAELLLRLWRHGLYPCRPGPYFS